MTENLQEEIIELISNTWGIEKEQIKPSSHFYDDLNVDTMMLNDLFLAIQERFKINLPTDKIASLQTVADLINLVEELSDEYL